MIIACLGFPVGDSFLQASLACHYHSHSLFGVASTPIAGAHLAQQTLPTPTIKMTSTQLSKFRVKHETALVNADGGTKSKSRRTDGKAQDGKVATAAIIQQHQSLDIAQTLLHGSVRISANI